MKKSELVWLRAEIAKYAADGTAIRGKINEARDRARYDLWNEKRVVGLEARRRLLAYAFLRGVPYRVVEPTSVKPGDLGCSEEAWHKDLAQSVSYYTLPDPERDQNNAAVALVYQEVLAWLAVPEQTDRKAVREAREAAGWALYRQRRAAAAARRGEVRHAAE